MRETVWHILLILVVTGAVFFTNLGEARLWDRDEPRNAGCAAEMMARGDLVVPTFNDELRHQKPVLLYWLIMSAYSLLGVNEFAARFWSATLAIGTTFATYGIARRLTNSTVALYAAIALATSLMFDVAARAATPDSVLTFFATSALLVYVLGTFKNTNDRLSLKTDGCWFPSNWFVVASMYALLGAGVLAKGPVGFLLPMAMVGLFLLIQTLPTAKAAKSGRNWSPMLRRFAQVIHPVHFLRTVWSMRPLTAASIILLVAAPWYLMVDAATEGEFTRLFFVGEHFGRATTPLENHRGGLWFYPLAILVGFFPWSVLWGPVLVGLIRGRKPEVASSGSMNLGRVPTTLLLCWVGVQVAAFSLVQTKLPSYVTPCYPALSILTAMCLVDFASRQKSNVNQGWFYVAFGGLAISGLAIVVGVGITAMQFLPTQIWLAGLGLIPLFTGGGLMFMLRRQSRTRLPAVFAGAACLFSIGLFGFGTTSVDKEQQSHLLFSQLDANDVLATFGCLESSWVFYADRPILELSTEPAAAKSKSELQPRDKFWERKARVSIESFLQANRNAVLITTDDQLEVIKKRLPEDFEVLQRAEYFLKNKQLLLIGRRRVDSVRQANAKHNSTTQLETR